MDGISLIGLPLLELEELDVLGLVELATEDEDLFCAEPTAGPPLIWWEGGGGAAKISKILVRLLKKTGFVSFQIFVIPNVLNMCHVYPKGKENWLPEAYIFSSVVYISKRGKNDIVNYL